MPRLRNPRISALLLPFAVLFAATLAGCGSGTAPVITVAPPLTPAVSLSATTLAFTGTTAGTTSAAQTVTVTSTGTASLGSIAVSVGGANPGVFTVSNNCPSSLNPGSACTITITFSPVSTATYTATISIADTATGSPQTITLTGSPTAASACRGSVTRPAYPTGSSNYAGLAINGKVFAGTTPQIGATVQLYASGTGGLGSAATALGSAATTDSNGAFAISAAYTCPNSLSMLYLVSKGGKPGATGTASTADVMVTVLGPCNGVASGLNFRVDEATTVAAAYAFAQFFSATGANMGATAGNFRGLALAANTAANIVNNLTGLAPGAAFPANAVTTPANQINALANALNACITTAANCTTLYAATTVSGSAAPANTFDAALSVAQHPGANTTAVYNATQLATAYTPALSAAPGDWALYVSYGGGGMNLPSGLGIDSTGQVWVANYQNVASLFSNTGVPVFTNGITGNNLINSYGLSIDQNDQAWIPNEQSSGNSGLGSISVFNSAGTPVTNILSGGLNYPVATLTDTSGSTWAVDYGNSHVSLYDRSFNSLAGTAGYTTSQYIFPVGVAVDSKCYAYIANGSDKTITKTSPDGTQFISYVVGNGPTGLAVDTSDNVWAADYYGNSVGQVDALGNVVGIYTNPAFAHPQALAVDGVGNIWVANYRNQPTLNNGTIAEIAGSKATVPGALLSPAIGYGQGAGLLESFAIAVDSGGNLWVTNFGNSTLTEFIGIAAPVRTPLIGPVAPTP